METIYFEDLKNENKKVLLVNVSKTYNVCNPSKAKCVTIGNWRVDKKRIINLDYIIGVANGEIVCVVPFGGYVKLVDDFDKITFPCQCNCECHRQQELDNLKKFSNNPEKYKEEEEFRRLNGRVYFIEKKKDIDNEFINKYKEKALKMENDRRIFYGPTRYINL